MGSIVKFGLAIAVALLLVIAIVSFSSLGPSEPKLITSTSGPYIADDGDPAEMTFYAVNTRDSRQSYFVEVTAGDDRFVNVGDSDGKTEINLGPAESGKETREASVMVHSTLNGTVDTYVTAKLFEEDAEQDELVKTKRIDVTAK